MEDFKFKPFIEMREEDYQLIGFKSGLEVHQQLLTERKLFCRCPAGRYSKVYNAEILRHMRPTLSELGEYDGTALMEFKTKKEIIYRINRDTVCTYEMDDTPPFEINDDALDIALEISMLYGSNLIDEVHIARKQYLDGSIPTGFQRTAIVSLDGRIPYRDGFVDVIQVSIEEDSCREVSDIGHRRTYITDRLGMPLIETVTAPAMKTPQQVAEVAEIIRKIARSTGHVRTGIGAARQDVNVSVTGGTRIEIKGVPRIPDIPLLTYNEAMRQWNLLKIMHELHKRGVTPETFSTATIDVTKLLRKTRFQPVQNSVASGMKVMAVLLKGFKGLLRHQTQTDTFFSREFSDRVRVVACITTLPNIIHSDSPSETLASSEWQAVKKQINASEDDTVVIVWGEEQDAVAGAREIVLRGLDATKGVPSETRQALRDGTNGFERILPGPDRMYPDTDLPPKKITPERVNRIKRTLPEAVWVRKERYQKLGVPADLTDPLTISPYARLFDKAVTEIGISPVFASVVLIQYPKRLKKQRVPLRELNADIFERVFRLVAQNRIKKGGVYYLLRNLLKNGGQPEDHLRPISDAMEINTVIADCSKYLSGMVFRNTEDKINVLTGFAMRLLNGRAEGSVVKAAVTKFTGEV
ncbi:MAG: Glu-tRNA(Gln) amidotransferase subunit GatE [Ignavibacteriaceae bacterium]|nr:Glu-tRNA(Gln) amidotransferase subunit GatE [Ignavibacteriaceae bacterium]